MTKKRILVCSEFSLSSTGYSRISKHILERLTKENRYEVVELAAFASPDDDRIHELPWKVIPCLPSHNDQRAMNEYQSHPCNANGRHIFNQVCLDFLPNTVIALKDFWYEPYLHTFPFRQHYNIIWYYPCDGDPQKPEWIDNIIDCDAVFTYTDWGANLLKRQCGTRGNVVGSMPIGVDTKKFFPIFNKKEVKKHFCFSDDSLVVGFVARNQHRKLFDDLLQSFVLFLENAPKDVAARTYLYLHTAMPDIGWDINRLLMEYGLGNKVLFTYYCKDCQNIFASVYSDYTQICKHCSNSMAVLPRPEDSMPDELLNLVYNFCDIYVGCSRNEGFGIPAAEAMCCAVPTCVVNYSGMEDLVNRCDAIPLEPLTLQREADSNRLVAVPNLHDLAGKLIELASLPNSMRKRIGFEQYQKATELFNWDKSLSQLVNVIDKLPVKDWHTPSRLVKPNLNIPNELNNEQLVAWGYQNIIGRPEFLNRYEVQQKTHALSMGIGGEKPNFHPYNRDAFIHECIQEGNYYNTWEQHRINKLGVK